MSVSSSLHDTGPAEALAAEIMELTRSLLLVHLRFLQPAFFQLPFVADPEQTLATDGFACYYGFAHILRSYRTRKELVTRDYLHTVLHCIYHHPFVDRRVDPATWDLACDIAVEAILSDLDLPDTACARSQQQAPLIAELKEQLPLLTAEAIFHYLRELQLPLEELSAIRDRFLADDHKLWYTLSQKTAEDKPDKEPEETPEKNSTSQDSPAAGRKGDREDQSQSRSEDSQSSSAQDPASDDTASQEDGKEQRQAVPVPAPRKDRSKQKKRWEDISSRIRTDLETASRHWSEKAGSLLETLRFVTREKVDYRDFLRRFAVSGEEVRINDEEFDYIFYTYGLSLYKNLPLVEPLEYKEVKKIREFVIAIDTSASVQGELVREFLRTTCRILLQEDTFFSKICLHILQCDSQLQSDTLITCREELEEFLDHLEIRGFGGTDFCPVFDYVKTLRQNHQLTDLKGMLYFTDGDGIYPARQPDYQTAFVFLNPAAQIQVPVWAMKVILDQDQFWTDYENQDWKPSKGTAL